MSWAGKGQAVGHDAKFNVFLGLTPWVVFYGMLLEAFILGRCPVLTVAEKWGHGVEGGGMRYIVIGIMVLLMGTGAWAGEMAMRSVYAVERMSCGACLEKIARGVASVDPRALVSGDPYKGVVVVDHDADSSSEMLGLVMAEMGYPAREITGDGADMEGVTLLLVG